jgi:hypothetical protein
MTKQNRNEWDPITTTPSGFVIWKRCGDGKIVVTKPGQTPGQALEGGSRPPVIVVGSVLRPGQTSKVSGIVGRRHNKERAITC